MASTRSSLRAASLFLLFSSINAAFTAKGCYPGTVSGERTLGLYNMASNSMTVEKCSAFCSDAEFFGLEYGRECYCGQANLATQVASSDCSFACSGNPAQKCGAGGRLSLFTNDAYVPPSSPDTVGDYTHVGCYPDSLDQRTLSSKVLYDADLTIEKCAKFCSDYEFFGVEYASQCYCGTEISAKEVPQQECRQRCGGNLSQACGASQRLNIYGAKGGKEPAGNPTDICGYTYKSCWSDQRDIRALRSDVKRESSMTVETCAEFCEGYTYFGLENGGECYCGDTLQGGQKVQEKDCTSVCGGDASQYCGSGDRLSLYIADSAL